MKFGLAAALFALLVVYLLSVAGREPARRLLYKLVPLLDFQIPVHDRRRQPADVASSASAPRVAQPSPSSKLAAVDHFLRGRRLDTSRRRRRAVAGDAGRSGWPMTTNSTTWRGMQLRGAATTSGVIAVSARSVIQTTRLRRF